MCVITIKKRTVALSKGDAWAMWEANSHGAGFCVWDEKSRTWIARKGFMTFEALWEAIEPYTGVDHILVVHFRIVSRGRVCAEQTHPFEVKLEEGKAFLFHNGTLDSELQLSLGSSDTAELAYRLSQLRLRKEQLKLLLKEGGLLEPLRSGSRFALCLPGEEDPLLVGDWQVHDGLAVSNNLWRFGRTFTGFHSYPFGGYGYGYCGWDAFKSKTRFAKDGKLNFELVGDEAYWEPSASKSALKGKLRPLYDMLALYVQDDEEEPYFVILPELEVPTQAITPEGELYKLKGYKALYAGKVRSFKGLDLAKTTLALKWEGSLLVLSEQDLLVDYSLSRE